MKNAAPHPSIRIRAYAVDCDGTRALSGLTFEAAITTALEYRLKFPHLKIHVCDTNEPPSEYWVDRSVAA